MADVKEAKEFLGNLFEKYFVKLDKIEELGKFARYAFDKLPDYWFIKPASSTGKYHPSFANGKYGLGLHTYCACLYWDLLYTAFENDLVGEYCIDTYETGLIAVIFHDALKYVGNLEYTTKTHDVDSAEWLRKRSITFARDEGITIADTHINNICSAIRTHMGPWSTDGPPKQLFERLVFIADYMASSKVMETMSIIEEVVNGSK